MLLLFLLFYQCNNYIIHFQLLKLQILVPLISAFIKQQGYLYVDLVLLLSTSQFILNFLQILYHSLPYPFIVSNLSTLIKHNVNTLFFSWWSYCCSCCLFNIFFLVVLPVFLLVRLYCCWFHFEFLLSLKL